MARLTLKVSPSTCSRNPDRRSFPLHLQPDLNFAGLPARRRDAAETATAPARRFKPAGLMHRSVVFRRLRTFADLSFGIENVS
jgi:hypothetical protein